MAKNILVWLMETSSVVLLMGPVLILIFGRSNDTGFIADVLRVQLLTAVFISLSGFWVTTAILSLISRRHRVWSWVYPRFAALLWIIHAQFFFAGWGRASDSTLRIQAAGACLVLTCALVGSWIVWKQPFSK